SAGRSEVVQRIRTRERTNSRPCAFRRRACSARFESSLQQRNSEPFVSDNPLEKFGKQRDFLIGIDSDGCAFDTMEVKHKECFIPNTIKHFGLQAISKYAREAAEFVNLYSKWRGINRFPALVNTIDLLLDRAEVTRRGVKLADITGLRDWIKRET